MIEALGKYQAEEHAADVTDDDTHDERDEVQPHESCIEEQDAERHHVLRLHFRIGDQEAPQEASEEKHNRDHADGWTPVSVAIR